MNKILVFIVSAYALVTCSAKPEERIIHVSPDAGDVRDGSAEHPFATPAEAQNALRALKANEPNASWIVSLAAGEYHLTEPLTFFPEDSGEQSSPVVWRGPADASARLVGARDLKGWRVRPDGRWEANVPMRQMHRFDVAIWFEQLYVNGTEVGSDPSQLRIALSAPIGALAEIAHETLAHADFHSLCKRLKRVDDVFPHGLDGNIVTCPPCDVLRIQYPFRDAHIYVSPTQCGKARDGDALDSQILKSE